MASQNIYEAVYMSHSRFINLGGWIVRVCVSHTHMTHMRHVICSVDKKICSQDQSVVK
jgi:hypothetical protein